MLPGLRGCESAPLRAYVIRVPFFAGDYMYRRVSAGMNKPSKITVFRHMGDILPFSLDSSVSFPDRSYVKSLVWWIE